MIILYSSSWCCKIATVYTRLFPSPSFRPYPLEQLFTEGYTHNSWPTDVTPRRATENPSALDTISNLFHTSTKNGAQVISSMVLGEATKCLMYCEHVECRGECWRLEYVVYGNVAMCVLWEGLPGLPGDGGSSEMVK